MSTLKVTNIQATGETASRAVSGVAAAWASATGYSTPAVVDSFNVASLTDNGTGRYQFNFTNDMSSAAGYSSTGSGGMSSTFTTAFRTSSCPREVKTASACDVSTAVTSGAANDAGRVSISIAGDLA